MKKILKTTHPGFIVAILCVVVVLLIILAVAGSAAVIGDRQGAGYDGKLVGGDNSGSGGNGGGVDCGSAKISNMTAEQYAWVKDAAGKYLNGDEDALISLIYAESTWNASSKNGNAIGLGQFMPGTAKGYKEFIGGSDGKGTNWPSGTVDGSSSDARYDAKRSIYAVAEKFSGHLAQYGNLQDAYEKGYHTYTNAAQKADADKGWNNMNDEYNKLKNSGGCKPTSTTETVGNGKCLPVSYIPQGGYNSDGSEHGFVSSWCGAASMAQVIYYFTKDSTFKGYNFQNTHRLASVGAVSSNSKESYVSLGGHANSKISNPDWTSIINSINNQHPVIIFTRGLEGNGNHIFVLVGYDTSAQQFYANDTNGASSPKACTAKVSHTVITKTNLGQYIATQGGGVYAFVVK